MIDLADPNTDVEKLYEDFKRYVMNYDVAKPFMKKDRWWLWNHRDEATWNDKHREICQHLMDQLYIIWMELHFIKSFDDIQWLKEKSAFECIK